MRSLTWQREAELGGRWSLLQRQKQDHAALDRMLKELLSSSWPEQDGLLRRVSRRVSRHAAAEAAVLWPALRRALTDGREITERLAQERREIDDALARLAQTAADDPRRPELVRRVVYLVGAEGRDQEDELLPRLQEVLDRRELRRLGLRWELVRRTAGRPRIHQPEGGVR
jgi:hypothetical protein